MFHLALYLIGITELVLLSLAESNDAGCCTPSDPVWNFDNPSSPFFTIDICDGLYAYGDGIYFGMFLVSDKEYHEEVIFVDAPPTLFNAIPNIVETITTNPITTILYSHHHADHIGAAKQIPNIENAEIICHELTQKQIEQRPDLNIPECTKTIKTTPYTLTVGDQELIIDHAGFRWHTDNDLFIFAPKQRTIMAVDMVFPGWIPFKNLGLATNPDSYREAHDFLLGITSKKYGDWINFIGGHVDKIGTRYDVELNAKYYDELFDAAKQSEVNIPFETFLKDNFPEGFNSKNVWGIVGGILDEKAKECARIMIQENKWNDVWEGTDTFMQDNCWWAIENNGINIA